MKLLTRAAAAILLVLAASARADVSELWGRAGERWSPTSRLPDFSFAGYHCGEAPLPDVPIVTDVKKHGAAGDGVTDDAKAFQAALDSAAGKGAVLVPEGRYVLGAPVVITKGHVVLRGAGPGKTVLVVPKSLEQLEGAKTTDGVKSSHAFGGGFIVVRGAARGVTLGPVAAPAKRGDRQLTLEKAPANVKAGDWVRLVMPAGPELGRHVHADQLDPGVATLAERKTFIDWAARVTAVDGARLTLDRSLRLDVRPEFKATASTYRPTVEEVGIEDLAFEFPGVPKKAHLKEEGFNAIHMVNAFNSWVRNVTIADADNGVLLGGCRNCRVENVRFVAPRRKAPTGHHAIWATGGSQDCLFTGFDVQTQYVHDLTVEGFASGNVFTRGKGQSLNFDHHSNAPYENLFTDLDLGDPRRLWSSGGRQDRGPHSGARSTLWNLRYNAGGKIAKLPTGWPQLTIVGVSGFAQDLTPDRFWIEPAAAGAAIEPANLYDAQLQRRLKSQPR